MSWKTGTDFIADLDTPLVKLSKSDVFTLRDACEGVQIWGGIGSGKTSGSGQAIASAYLRAGMGGMVCCAKPEEVQLWLDYCRANGRSSSVIVFDESQGYNFIDAELARHGFDGIATVVECIMRSIPGCNGADAQETILIIQKAELNLKTTYDNTNGRGLNNKENPFNIGPVSLVVTNASTTSETNTQALNFSFTVANGKLAAAQAAAKPAKPMASPDPKDGQLAPVLWEVMESFKTVTPSTPCWTLDKASTLEINFQAQRKNENEATITIVFIPIGGSSTQTATGVQTLTITFDLVKKEDGELVTFGNKRPTK